MKKTYKKAKLWKKKIIGKCVELKNWVGVELVGRKAKIWCGREGRWCEECWKWKLLLIVLQVVCIRFKQKTQDKNTE